MTDEKGDLRDGIANLDIREGLIAVTMTTEGHRNALPDCLLVLRRKHSIIQIDLTATQGKLIADALNDYLAGIIS